MSLYEPHGSPLGSDLLTSSDASATLSGTSVENEFVRGVYTDISWWYDYFFGPTLHAGRLESMERIPIEPDSEVLEVGVGSGINALLYPSECSVVGIDFSASMLSKAARRLERHGRSNVKLRKMDAADLVFEDESFDVVYAPYVISVVSEPIKVIQEMYRVCRVGGHVVVLNHFLSQNRILARAERLMSPLTVHIGFRADLDLPKFIQLSGFEPISIEKVNFPRLWSLVIFRKVSSEA